MPNETQNHGLLIYSIGEENWTHTPDIETIEQRLPVTFDIEENLSEYEPHDGSLFIDSETGKVFEGDGAEWSHAERDFMRVFEDGSRVATRDYVDSELDGFEGSGSDVPEIHDNDYHDPDYATTDALASHEGETADVHGTDESGVASQSDIDAAMTAHVEDYEHGGGGNEGVSEAYVDDEIDLHAGIIDAHHPRFTDSEAVDAVDGSDASVAEAEEAGNATFWDGYELVFDDETPETDQYIRLETGN